MRLPPHIRRMSCRSLRMKLRFIRKLQLIFCAAKWGGGGNRLDESGDKFVLLMVGYSWKEIIVFQGKKKCAFEWQRRSDKNEIDCSSSFPYRKWFSQILPVRIWKRMEACVLVRDLYLAKLSLLIRGWTRCSALPRLWVSYSWDQVSSTRLRILRLNSLS